MSQTLTTQGIVKAVQSGDYLTLVHPSKKPPVEKKVSLAFVTVPKYGRKNENEKDEPFGFEAREYVRKMLIGKTVTIDVKYSIFNSKRDFVVVTADGKNLNLGLLKAGLATLKIPKTKDTKEGEPSKFADIEKEYQNAELEAKNAKVGIWSDKKNVKEIKKDSDVEVLYKEYHDKPVQVIVERVFSGSSISVLLPNGQLVNLNFTGVQCPRSKKEEGKKGGEKDPIGKEAKEYTQHKLLQREFTLVIEDFEKKPNFNSLTGTLLTSKDTTFSEELLSLGLAHISEYSIGNSKYAKQLRSAQSKAQTEKKKMWTNFKFSVTLKDQDKKTLSGKVIDISRGDTFTVRLDDKKEEKFSLSSIKAPARDHDYFYESIEALRKRIAGKKVTIKVDYRKTLGGKTDSKKKDEKKKDEKKEEKKDEKNKKPQQSEERRYVTLISNGKNVGVEIVATGYAEVVKHFDTEERSSVYDQLLQAEQEAKDAQKHIFAKDKKKEYVAPKDLTALPKLEVNLELPRLKDRKMKAAIERVVNGSRFKVFLPQENEILSFTIDGVTCPGMGKLEDEKKPFAKEAYEFSFDNCLFRDVEIIISRYDQKTGSFYGQLLLEGKDFAVALLENGFAKLLSGSKTFKNYSELSKAETIAKDKKLNLHSIVQEEKKEKKQFEKKSTDYTLQPGNVEGFFQIRVTEIKRPDHIYLQTQDASNQLVQLEKLMSELNLNESTVPTDFKPKEKSLVFCQFSEDNNWYRARITKVEKNQYSVFYVDFGNQETVKFSALRPMPKNITDIPFQAKEAFLAYIRPHHTNFVDESLDTVSDFCLDKDLLARVEYKVGNRIYISIFDEKGKFSLNSDLVRNGLVFITKNLELTEGQHAEKFKKPLAELQKNLDEAKKEKLNLWQLGDVYDEDEE